MAHKLFERDRAPLRRPARRLHPHPQAGAAPRGQRPDGAHRVRRSRPGPLSGRGSGRLSSPRSASRPAPSAIRRGHEGRTGCAASACDVAYLRRAGFHGFALQPGVRTVGGALAGALERHLRHTVELTCAGRTDAGVHAWGQVVSFDARADVDPTALQRAVNRALRPGDRGPRRRARPARIRRPPLGDRAGATATRCATTPWPIPSRAATAWHVAPPLDLRGHAAGLRPAVRGARLLVVLPAAAGARGVTGAPGPRTPTGSTSGDGMLRFDIEASSFCQQMVRSIVGTLVDVGRGRAQGRGDGGRRAGPLPRPPPASWLRLTACACGQVTY